MSKLFEKTTLPEEPLETLHVLQPDEAGAETGTEGRGETGPESPAAAPKPRRKRALVGKTVHRKVVVMEEADERVYQHARKTKTTYSAVVNGLIMRHIPKYKVSREP